MFQALHGADEHGNPGAVDVRDVGKIYDEALGLLIDDRAERSAQFGGNVEIDRALGSENILGFRFGHLGGEHAIAIIAVSRHLGSGRVAFQIGKEKTPTAITVGVFADLLVSARIRNWL
jgi:hypothetical protein